MKSLAAAVPAGICIAAEPVPLGRRIFPALRHLAIALSALLCAGGCSIFSLPVVPSDLPPLSPVRFAADSFWYAPIVSPEVDPDSDRYMRAMISRYEDRFTLVLRDGSVTVFHADAEAPTRSVPLTGSQWIDGREAAGVREVPLPEYVYPDAGSDGHLALIDTARGLEFDFWQFRMVKGRWVASIAAVIDLESDGVHRGETVRASGFALTAGMIWPEEISGSGEIEHALVFGYPHTKKGVFVPPASWTDGWEESDEALPIGAHLQLDPSLDLEDPSLALTEYEKKIGRALQTYGMYLHDTGSVGSIVELEAVNPASRPFDPYRNIPGFMENGYEHGYVSLSPVLLRNLRVLRLPEERTPESHPLDDGSAWASHFSYK